MVAVGRGIIGLDDVKRFIDDPNNTTTVSRPDVNVCPAHGLYLANVEYHDKGLILPASSSVQSFVPLAHRLYVANVEYHDKGLILPASRSVQSFVPLAHGLYLANVEYHDKGRILSTSLSHSFH